MAKVNGLNVRLYVEGYDLSGDANALSGLGYTNELLDVTTLDVSAKKRIVGVADAEVSVDAFFDPASSDPTRSGRPTAASSRLPIRTFLYRWGRRWATRASGWSASREHTRRPAPLVLRSRRTQPIRLQTEQD